MDQPLDMSDLHRRIRAMIEDAEQFIQRIPSDAVGFVFLQEGKPVQPDLTALGNYVRRAGARADIWPTSPEVSQAMLEHYGKPGSNTPKT